MYPFELVIMVQKVGRNNAKLRDIYIFRSRVPSFCTNVGKNIAYGDFDSTAIDVVLLYKNLVNFVPTFVHTS